VAQFIRPVSDVSTGSWTSTPLWSKLDDNSDADLVTSDDNTNPDTAELEGTNSGINDPTSNVNHVLRARIRKEASGGHNVTFNGRLYQGTGGGRSLIATVTEADGSATMHTISATLSGTEADNISDYNDLYFEIERAGDTGGPPGNRRFFECAWIELEVPDATVNTQIDPGVAAISLASFAPAVVTPVAVAPGLAAISLTSFAPTAVVPLFREQASFRGRNDDGTDETDATWIAALNTDWNQAADATFRVRFLVKNLGNQAGADQTFQLTASHNAGAYFDVTGSSTIIKAVASTKVVEGANTTQQLGAGTFVTPNAGIDEVDGQAGGTALDFAGYDEVELEFVLQIIGVDVSDSDTIDLRLNVL